MATYANMCEVRVGDIVQCLRPDDCKGLLADHNYTVSGVVVYSTSQFVQLSEKCGRLEYPIKWFKLISRAPSPEPEQPKVNGVYASGEVPEVGDEFEAIESYSSFYKTGDRFRIREFSHFGYIHADGLGGGFAAKRFKLISRKEQPAVNNEQSPPLVEDSILVRDLEHSWKHAVRAYNFCENSELNDTASAMREIVVKLSQQLEFHQSQSGVI